LSPPRKFSVLPLVVILLLWSPAALHSQPAATKAEAVTTEDSAAEAAEPSTQESVHIVYSAMNGMGEGYTGMFNLDPYFEGDDKLPVKGRFGTISDCVLTDGSRYLLPEDNFADVAQVGKVLTSKGQLDKKILATKLPVLMAYNELTFQYPYENHVSVLRPLEEVMGLMNYAPDIERRTADLVRYTNGAGESFLSLELEPDAPLQRNLLSYQRILGTPVDFISEDDSVRLFGIGRRFYRGSRVKAELKQLITQDSTPGQSRTLFLHPGGLVTAHILKETPQWLQLYGSAISELNLTAIVPQVGELSLGPNRLAEFINTYDLPYIAANLRPVRESEEKDSYRRLMPRYKIVTVGSLKVGIVGIVGDDQLEELGRSARTAWEFTDPRYALDQALQSMQDHLGQRPDLTVILLGSVHGKAVTTALATEGVDIVIGNFRGIGTLAKNEQFEYLPERGGREAQKGWRSLFAVRGSGIAVGRLTARFSPHPQGRRLQLIGIENHSHPVLPDGPVDEEMEQRIRALVEADVGHNSQILLPDPEPFARKHKELHPLVWGKRILFGGRYYEVPETYPAAFTDALWMQFVTNTLRTRFKADVAISRNLPHNMGSAGPIPRWILMDLLDADDELRLVTLKGKQLAQLGARMRLQNIEGKVKPFEFLFASGFDAPKNRVRGAPLDPKAKYRVLVTDYVMEMPELAPIFKGTDPDFLFKETSHGYKAAGTGEQVSIRTAVLRSLESWVDPETTMYSNRFDAEFDNLLLDHSGQAMSRWDLDIAELSVSGSYYGNTKTSGPDGLYLESKETRVSTPANYNVYLRGDLGLKYEGPLIGWENRVQATLNRTVLDIKEIDVASKEQADDLVAWSEFRLNMIGIEMGKDRFPMMTFIRTAVDTEFTPTPNPTARNQTATLPHQLLTRLSAGQVAFPGSWLKEARVGALFQADVSNKPHRYDFGFMGYYRLSWEIFKYLTFASEMEGRYLIPDRDDTSIDLALVLTANHKLIVPIVAGLSIFTFADLYFVQGKVDVTREFGGSYIIGMGLQYAESYRL
jgi:hypothetical protein